MNEQKRNRMAAAITVNGILLIVILVAVVIYQLAAMSLAKSRRSRLEAELVRYEQLIEQGQGDLEYLQTEQGILDILFEMGYVFPD